jgi:hypothetical protein
MQGDIVAFIGAVRVQLALTDASAPSLALGEKSVRSLAVMLRWSLAPPRTISRGW